MKTTKQEVKEVIREIKFVPRSLKEMAKQDNMLMRALRLDEIRHILCHSDKGDIALMLRKEQTERDYRFVLDSVPVTDEKNKELTKIFNNIIFTI